MAAQWATKGKDMAKIIAQNPTAKYVWLTVGGNDGMLGLSQKVPIAVVMSEVAAAM